MDVQEYHLYVLNLEQRLQTLQNEYIASRNDTAQLIGPLLAITMLVKSDLLPFARDRYQAIINGPDWKIAEDHILKLREEVEYMLAGPGAFIKQNQG